MAKVLDEICDFCWDEKQVAVSAYELISGIPLCLDHINKTKTTQSRFDQAKPEPAYSNYEVSTPPVKKVAPKIEKPKTKPMTTMPIPTITPMPTQISSPIVASPSPSRSSTIAAKGINTGYDLAQFMSAVMTDLIEGKIDPQVATATCAAADRLLKVVEMQIKYGKEKDGVKTLQLSR